MHIFRYSVLFHEWVSSFFFSRNTTQNFNNRWGKFQRIIKPGIFTKPDGFHSVFGKNAVPGNPRIILLLITFLMVSGIIIPGVCAAGPLVVDFNAVPQFGTRPLGVQFNDTTTSADPANNTYLWKFGDGGTSTLKNPRHTYTTSGTFTVNLTVREITGKKATLSKLFYIHVADTANATDFSGTPQCGFSPLPVQFIDGTTIVHDTWQWDFGDGGASNVSDPLYTYNGQGSWNVSLYISNTSGGPQSLISKSGYIQVIPVADTSFSAVGTRDNSTLTVQFNDTSTGFVSPVTWFWDFGDGTTATEQNPSHTYADPSLSYLVSFTVTGYCSQTITQLGYISASGGSLVVQPTSVPLAPVADFTGAPLSGAAPLDVTFADLSVDAPTSWSWLFGDGNSSTIRNPVHTYASPGNYTVSLTAFNSIGSSSKTRTKYITVSGYLLAPPVGQVDFTGTPTAGAAPLTVQFTSVYTGFAGPVSYLWDFGDGSTSTMRNPSHTYTAYGSGYQTVSLVVTGSDGQTDAVTKSGYVNIEIPTIELTISDLPPDPSLLGIQPAPPAQSSPQASSSPLDRSELRVQSSPMAVSIPPALPGYEDLSMPKDSSPQNGISAASGEPNSGEFIWPRSGQWSLTRGDNPISNAFYLVAWSNVNWKVDVWDPMSGGKPDGTAGKMAEYDYTKSMYVPPPLGNVLHQSLYIRHGPGLVVAPFIPGDYVVLSKSRHTILTGSEPGWIGPVDFNQHVESSDTELGKNKGYRIVILFEASNTQV
jgi:PKD repeat protein